MEFNSEQDKLAAMILGRCEQDADHAAIVFDNFKPAHFPYEAEIVFRAYLKYYRETGDLPNREVMALTEIKADDVQDIENFLDLVDEFQDSELPASYVKEKTALYHRRMEFEQTLMDVADVVDAGETFDAATLEEAEGIMKKSVENYKPLICMKPKSVADEMSEFVEFIQKPDERKVVPTGFPRLDEYLNDGLVEKTLTVLLATTHRRQDSDHAEHGIPPSPQRVQRPLRHP